MERYEMANMLQNMLEEAETDMKDIPGFEGKYAITRDG